MKNEQHDVVRGIRDYVTNRRDRYDVRAQELVCDGESEVEGDNGIDYCARGVETCDAVLEKLDEVE